MLTKVQKDELRTEAKLRFENYTGDLVCKIIDGLPEAEEPTFKYIQPASCIGCMYITESLVCTISEKDCTRKEIRLDYYQPR